MLAMIPKPFRGKAGIGNVMGGLAGKMLEYGRDHWPKWINDRLARIAKSGAQSTLAVAFTEIKRVENLLNDLKGNWLSRNKKEKYPISINLTGLTEDIHECCKKTGLKEHTYLHSLGFFGRRVPEIPSGDELSLITMCGHGLIASGRIKDLVRSIRDGELTPEEAAEDIARPCQCGISNKPRAQEIFRRLAAKEG